MRIATMIAGVNQLRSFGMARFYQSYVSQVNCCQHFQNVHLALPYLIDWQDVPRVGRSLDYATGLGVAVRADSQVSNRPQIGLVHLSQAATHSTECPDSIYF